MGNVKVNKTIYGGKRPHLIKESDRAKRRRIEREKQKSRLAVSESSTDNKS